MDKASATKTVDSISIPGRVKREITKKVSTASLLDIQHFKDQCEASDVCGRQMDRWQFDFEDRKASSLPLDQRNLVTKHVL